MYLTAPGVMGRRGSSYPAHFPCPGTTTHKSWSKEFRLSPEADGKAKGNWKSGVLGCSLELAYTD